MPSAIDTRVASPRYPFVLRLFSAVCLSACLELASVTTETWATQTQPRPSTTTHSESIPSLVAAGLVRQQSPLLQVEPRQILIVTLNTGTVIVHEGLDDTFAAMRTSSPLSLRRALLLTSFFAAGVYAQQNNDDEDEAQTSQTQNTQPTPTNNRPSTSSANAQTSQTSSPTNAPPPLSSSTQSEETLPSLPQPTADLTLTDLPTLSSRPDLSIPTYPPPAIPPTHNAPFMNHSTLPDGTVFIAVGAILAAFGLAVLLWRGILVCLLHRSVERAAMAQHAANDKSAASFPAPPAQFYKYLERESNASLPVAGANSGTNSGIGTRRTHRGPTPSATPSQTNLFFSPTAGHGAAMGGGGAGAGSSNRDSRFLPSGFYASASPNPGGAGAVGGGGGGGGHQHGNSVSLSTLRPASRGRGQMMGPSPPESPSIDPRMGGGFSSSSLNLNRPPSAGARAPSAYLDDLLDDQPGLFPPAGGQPGQQGGGYNGGQQKGRF